MVGALADWFAVVALFRRIPLPFVARHTAIIPRNKDRIADNLGRFVEEKFLDTPSLVALIRRYQPALMLGNWFSQPENARRVGQHLLQVMSGFLELTDDARIQRLLRRAVHKAIDKVDLTQTSAMMLEGLTRDNRHQKLLDSLINQLIALLQRDSSRAFIARGIVHWLETEHPLKAKLLPTEWLGEHSAEMVTDAVNTLLDEVTHDRTHQIRQTFDRAVQKLIDNLKSDPDMAQKADNIKARLKNNETFNHYLGEVWGDLRGWVKTISAATTHVLSSASPRRGSGSVKPYSATTRCANRLTNTGAGGAPGGAGVRRLPHPPYQRHSEELGRPRYVAADRAQYR